MGDEGAGGVFFAMMSPVLGWMCWVGKLNVVEMRLLVLLLGGAEIGPSSGRLL